jgi:NDP-sugar pyrophosphorylase family protein
MLPVGDRPMLEIAVERCVKAGFRELFVSVNYLKEQIIDHFGEGSRWGADLRYLAEVEPLGTAGSLGLLPNRPDRPVLVMNGDVLSRVDFAALLKFHESHQVAATLCVRAHETQIPFGVIHTEGVHVKSVEEKPVLTHYVNAGIYLVNPELLDLLPADQPCDMPELLELALAQNLKVAVFPLHEYWLDVGTHGRLDQAKKEWS